MYMLIVIVVYRYNITVLLHVLYVTDIFCKLVLYVYVDSNYCIWLSYYMSCIICWQYIVFYNCINTSFICNSYLLYACTTLYLYYYNMYMFTVIVVYNCFITCTICNSYLLYTRVVLSCTICSQLFVVYSCLNTCILGISFLVYI